jgi:hypothetical protein
MVHCEMILILLGLLQSAPSLPDIQFVATINARSVTIEKQGVATLEVHAAPDDGSVVKIDAPKAHGAKTLRNVRIAIDAQARIGRGPQADAIVEHNVPLATEAEPQR